MSEAISVGSVSVDIVPDTRRLSDELKAKTRDLSVTVGAKLDDKALRTKLDEATHDRTSTINANADTTAANARLDEAARDRTAHIRVKSSGIDSASRGMSGMMTAALGLGPALIPVVGVAAGLGAAFAAPLAAAGGGLTLGAFIAGKAVAQTEKQSKAIDALKKKVDAAKQSLASTQASSGSSSAASLASAHQSMTASVASAQLALGNAKTPAAIAAAQGRIAAAQASYQSRVAAIQASSNASTAAAQRKVAEATAAYQAALKGLSPEQTKFIAAQGAMKGAFTHLLAGPGGKAIFAPLIVGMDDLSKIMPKLSPLLTGVSKGVGTLLGDVDKFASSKGFDSFMKGFGKESGGAIVSFGRDFENVVKGVVGILGALSPLTHDAMNGVSGLTQEFANFGTHAGSNSGFQHFIAYVHDEGPLVWHTLVDIGGAVGNLVTEIAPLGGLVLGAVDGFAAFVRHADPSTLAGIGVAVGGIALAMGKGPLGLAFSLAATLSHSDKFVSFLKTAGGYARDFGKWFDKLPSGIKAASLAMVGVGALAVKFKGGIGGLLGGKSPLGGGGILGALGKMKPVPVYVTNKGFGGAGGLVGDAEGAAGGGLAATAGAAGATLAVATIVATAATVGIMKLEHHIDPKGTRDGAPQGSPEGSAAGAGGGLTLPQNAIDFSTPADRRAYAAAHSRKTAQIMDVALGVTGGKWQTLGPTVRNLGDDMQGLGVKAKKTADQAHYMNKVFGQTPKDVRTRISAPGLNGAMSAVRKYGSWLDGLDGKTVHTFIKTNIAHHANQLDRFAGGIPRGATGGIVNRPTVALIGEAGPEAVVPLNRTPGNSPLPRSMAAGMRGGFYAENVNIHGVLDLNQAKRDVEHERRVAALGGADFT